MTTTLTDVRNQLMATLQELRAPKPMETDRARAIAQVAGVLIESARVEVDYIKATGGAEVSSFLESPGTPTQRRLPASATSGEPSAHNPFPGRKP